MKNRIHICIVRRKDQPKDYVESSNRNIECKKYK